MTEATTANPTVTIPAALDELLRSSGFPPAAFDTFKSAFGEAYGLALQNNKWVAQVNQAKASDPNNTEYLDALWKANSDGDPEITEKAEAFYAIAEEYEKLNAELRELGKKQIKEALSEEQIKATREKVNAAAPTIKTATEKAAAMAEMFESVLSSMNIKLPENGLMSFLPEVESLKNTRGRKAATQAGGIPVYVTRTGGILIDGVSTNKDGKGKFAYGADKLSEMFGAAVHPENAVSVEELEEAFWKAYGKPFRSEKSTELPEAFEFEFSKTIKVQNKNDDSFTEIPKTVKVTVLRAEPTNTKAKTEGETPEAKPEAPTEKVEAKVETAKIEAPKTETVPAPAKKTAAPVAKK